MTHLEMISEEANEASARYGAFRSTHEGFGVLSEEIAELLDAIRSNRMALIEQEAIQVAAVALRIAECTQNAECVGRSTK